MEIGFIMVLAAILLALEWKTYDHFDFGKAYKSNYQGEEMLTPLQINKKQKAPIKPKSFMVLTTVPDDIDAAIDEDDLI